MASARRSWTTFCWTRAINGCPVTCDTLNRVVHYMLRKHRGFVVPECQFARPHGFETLFSVWQSRYSLDEHEEPMNDANKNDVARRALRPLASGARFAERPAKDSSFEIVHGSLDGGRAHRTGTTICLKTECGQCYRKVDVAVGQKWKDGV